MFRYFILFIVALALSACATMSPETRHVLDDRQDLPRTARVQNLSAIKFPQGQCGVGALKIVTDWAGGQLSWDEISKEVYNKEKDGSLKSDLIAFSRNQGYMATSIKGMSALLDEVSAGHPVIVLQNLGFNWMPNWHFAVVASYDLNSQKISLHSGKERPELLPLTYFEKFWQGGEFWGLVVLPPGRLPVSVSELENMQAGAQLEKIGQLAAADKVYEAVLVKWPESLAALIGRGNVAYQEKKYAQAVKYFSQAADKYPDSAAAAQNLKLARAAFKNH